MLRAREGDEWRGLQGVGYGVAARGEEEGDAVEGFAVCVAGSRGAGAGAGGGGTDWGGKGVWVFVVYAYVGGRGGGCVLL